MNINHKLKALLIFGVFAFAGLNAREGGHVERRPNTEMHRTDTQRFDQHPEMRHDYNQQERMRAFDRGAESGAAAEGALQNEPQYMNESVNPDEGDGFNSLYNSNLQQEN